MATKLSKRERERRARQRQGASGNGADTFAASRPAYLQPGQPGGPAGQLPPDREPARELWTGTELREGASFFAELPTRPGKLFQLRRVDPFDLFMKGVISMPLLDAVSRTDEIRAALAKDPKNLRAIPDADKKIIMDTMQQYARVVVIAPQLVEKDDGDPAHCPIDLLTFWDLMCIMKATPVANRAPSVGVAGAAEFRREEPRVDGAAAPDGHDLRGASERIPTHTRPPIERA